MSILIVIGIIVAIFVDVGLGAFLNVLVRSNLISHQWQRIVRIVIFLSVVILVSFSLSTFLNNE